jgi:polyhydroxyalkanoate synthesis regulator phasin
MEIAEVLNAKPALRTASGLTVAELERMKKGELNADQLRQVLIKLQVTPESAAIHGVDSDLQKSQLPADLKSKIQKMIDDQKRLIKSGTNPNKEVVEKIEALRPLIRGQEDYKADKLAENKEQAKQKLDELVKKIEQAGVTTPADQAKIAVQIIAKSSSQADLAKAQAIFAERGDEAKLKAELAKKP